MAGSERPSSASSRPSCGTSIGSSLHPLRWPSEGARDQGGARKKYPRDGGDTPMVHIIAILLLLARYAAEWVRFQWPGTRCEAGADLAAMPVLSFEPRWTLATFIQGRVHPLRYDDAIHLHGHRSQRPRPVDCVLPGCPRHGVRGPRQDRSNGRGGRGVQGERLGTRPRDEDRKSVV